MSFCRYRRLPNRTPGGITIGCLGSEGILISLRFLRNGAVASQESFKEGRQDFSFFLAFVGENHHYNNPVTAPHSL
jgi:hypothetical protein